MSIQKENINETNTIVNTESTQNPQESQEQINWKKFREDRENDRKKREAAEKSAAESQKEALALKAAVESLLNKPSPQSSSDDIGDKTEEQRIKQTVEQLLVERERQTQEARRQQEIAEFPQKLVQVYSDFNEVCTSENLDYMEFHYPEIAHAFKNVPDGFDKWSNIYKAVKKLIPNPQSGKDQKKAEKNAAKPQSMAVAGLTQSSDNAPQKFDDQRRKDNWTRMQKVMKGIK